MGLFNTAGQACETAPGEKCQAEAEVQGLTARSAQRTVDLRRRRRERQAISAKTRIQTAVTTNEEVQAKIKLHSQELQA